MKNLKAGVVGYGHLGRYHAQKYAEMEGAELAGIADVSPDAREKAAEHGVPVYENHAELVDKVDAVSIATVTETHLEVARDFLLAGVPVLVEKPLASTLDQARELEKISKENGVLLQAGHIERFNPAIVAASGRIKSPRFIQADRVSPFSFRSVDIGVVMDVMIHDIDLILNLVGKPVKSVSALGVPVLGLTEDIASAQIVFDDGCVANVTASRVAIKTERKIRIFQEDAYVNIDFAAQNVQVYRKKDGLTPEKVASIRAREVDNPLMLMLAEFIEHENVEVEKYDQLTREIESFLDAVRRGTEPVVTASDGVEAIRVAGMIIESLKNPPWEK